MEQVSFTAERTINLTCFDCLRVFCDACRYATHSHNFTMYKIYIQTTTTTNFLLQFFHHKQWKLSVPESISFQSTIYTGIYLCGYMYVLLSQLLPLHPLLPLVWLYYCICICNIPYCLANFMAKEVAFFRLEYSVCIVHVAMDKCILLLLGWNIFVVWECLTFMKGIMWIFFLSFFIP